jgi:hypothetical protein
MQHIVQQIDKILQRNIVMDANILEFIYMNLHSLFVINLYLIHNPISIHFQLASY